MRMPSRLAAMIAAIGILPVAAYAGQFTGLVVFGDSLSDVGNDAIVTPQLSAYGITPTPGPYYSNGRFSNGPNYVDDLSSALGLPDPTPSLAGGTDYAYGDAQTAGSPALQRLVISDVDQQVSTYLGKNTPSAGTLYDIFAGANDLTNNLSTATASTATTAASNIQTDVSTLYAAGARQFLIPNLPLLGETPAFNTTAAASSLNALTLEFNTALAGDLNTLQASDPGIVIYQLDVQSLFTDLQNDPSMYGLTDVTDSAAPGLEPGATSYDTSLEVSDPNQYLFWDDEHPTAAGHALLANAAESVLMVPEPTSVSLFAAGATLLIRRRRR